MNDPRAFWNRIAPLNRAVLIFALANALLVPLVLRVLAGTSSRDAELGRTLSVLRLRRPGNDSWLPMAGAVTLAGRGQGPGLYQTLFFEQQVKFQYPPTSLLVLEPLLRGPLADALARHGVSWVLLLHGLSWLLLGVTACAVASIYLRGLRESSPEAGARTPGRDRAAVLLAAVCLTLTFYPVLMAHSLGQIQVWLNALFALLLWSWMLGRERQAGALLGLMCLIKPQYGVLVLWGLLRRRWGFVLASGVVGGIGLALSLGLYGLGDHLDYLRVLSFIARHGESYHPNQSVNGLLNRLLFNGPNLEWQPHAFAPFHVAVYIGTLATSVLLLALALFGPMRRRTPAAVRGSAADLALMALAGTLASPVAWEHHYGILLPIFAFLLPRLVRQPVCGRWTLPLLGASYLLVSHYLVCVHRLAATPFNPLQSYLLAGAVLALMLLYRLCRVDAQTVCAASFSDASQKRSGEGEERFCEASLNRDPEGSALANALPSGSRR